MPQRAKRVKVAGDLFHGRIPDGAVYVGRAAPGLAKSPFANPFRADDRAEAVRLFEEWLADRPDLCASARAELAGRDLACWCPLPAAGDPDHCHAAVLVDIANGKECS